VKQQIKPNFMTSEQLRISWRRLMDGRTSEPAWRWW